MPRSPSQQRAHFGTIPCEFEPNFDFHDFLGLAFAPPHHWADIFVEQRTIRNHTEHPTPAQSWSKHGLEKRQFPNWASAPFKVFRSREKERNLSVTATEKQVEKLPKIPEMFRLLVVCGFSEPQEVTVSPSPYRVSVSHVIESSVEECSSTGSLEA